MANVIYDGPNPQTGLTLAEELLRGKYVYHKFFAAPTIVTKASSVDALPTALQGQTDNLIFGGPNGFYAELYQSTAQTLLPSMESDGLLISGDLVDNESQEIVPGGNSALSPFARTINTDSTGMFIEAVLEVADVSGTDQTFVGFRKQEAFAVPSSLLVDPTYTDIAGFVLVNGDVKTTTDLNNGGTATVTDTLFNIADADVVKLKVRIDKGGVVSYFINGVALGGTVTKDGAGTAITAQATAPKATFTFDSGDVVIPMIFVRHDTTTPGKIHLKSLELGRLNTVATV